MEQSDVYRVLDLLGKRFPPSSKVQKGTNHRYWQWKVGGNIYNVDNYSSRPFGYVACAALCRRIHQTSLPFVERDELVRRFQLPPEVFLNHSWEIEGEASFHRVFRNSIGVRYEALTTPKLTEILTWVIEKFPAKSDYKGYLGQQIATEVCEKILGKAVPEATPNFLVRGSRGGLRLDAYWPDLNFALEFQGQQHFQRVRHWHRKEEDFERQIERDQLKRELCAENGVTLLEIPFWADLTEESIAQTILQTSEASNAVLARVKMYLRERLNKSAEAEASALRH